MLASRTSSTIPDPHLWILILAGGAGTRFWPASTPGRPKQLLPLAGENPLIRDTLDRARGLAPDERIRVLTGSRLVGPFSRVLDDLPASSLMVEPQARGTGPVLVWAARTILASDPDAVLVSLHADHAIRPWEAFRSLVARGTQAARATGGLLTVAVPPSRPETGFGYIQPGEESETRDAESGASDGESGASDGESGARDAESGASDGESAARVRAFVEKPDLETATRYVSQGYLWNSGIFIWSASAFLREVRAVAPELGDLLPLLERGDVDGFFREAPSVSVDEAVLERSSNVFYLRATFEWDDLGAWEALARTRERDVSGNVAIGSVQAVDSEDNIAMADEGDIVLFGVKGLVVVRSGPIVLVADRARTPDLKSLLETLPPRLRDPDPDPEA